MWGGRTSNNLKFELLGVTISLSSLNDMLDNAITKSKVISGKMLDNFSTLKLIPGKLEP